MRIARGREAPGAEIDGVERDAEEIGGNEAELGGAGSNDADDGAIDGADHPALPELLAEQDGAENCQNAGDVIQSNCLEYVSHVVFKGLPDSSGSAASGSYFPILSTESALADQERLAGSGMR